MMEKERLEIIVGDPKKPFFHLTSTVSKLVNLVNDVQKIMAPAPSYPTLTPMPAKKEPIEIREIRHKYNLIRDDLYHEHKKKMKELAFEEELAIEHAKTKGKEE